jgi:co-chaperonin GroES (HSP10)
MEVSGVRLERKTYDFIETEERIRPLRDYIVVKPLEWNPSRTIQIAGNTRRTLRGTVVAVGPGCYPKVYNRDRSKCWLSKAFRRTQVRAGDVVELGGLEIDGYSFPTISIGNETHIICREEDVCGVVL